MTSILITCVNYNTYDKVMEFLESIKLASQKAQNLPKIDVLIGDNSEKIEPIQCEMPENIKIYHINNQANLGYLGGVNKALELSKIEKNRYDFFIISNVDLRLSPSFFIELTKINIEKDLGWIAPSIISEKEGRDRNPKILSRPSSKRLKILLLFYQFPLLNYLYTNLVYRFKNKALHKRQSDFIYAGHGSFMIFTKNFSQKNHHINFPCFLFGEEIYFAELVKKSNLQTRFTPSIVIYDFDHANTASIKSKKYHELNYKAIKYILETFYN